MPDTTALDLLANINDLLLSVVERASILDLLDPLSAETVAIEKAHDALAELVERYS